jgi:septum formation protein
MTHRRLVLASASPRRRDLLSRLELGFDVIVPDIDESRHPGEDAGSYVRRLASTKIQIDAGHEAVVIAADTVVTIDSEVLGKPDDEAHGREMLSRLAGREHEVITGVAVRVVADDTSAVGSESTKVQVADLSDVRVDWYVESGEGADKAGGYALQGAAALFADRVEGSVSNVIGLPLPLLDRLCIELGVDLLSFREHR